VTVVAAVRGRAVPGRFVAVLFLVRAREFVCEREENVTLPEVLGIEREREALMSEKRRIVNSWETKLDYGEKVCFRYEATLSSTMAASSLRLLMF